LGLNAQQIAIIASARAQARILLSESRPAIACSSWAWARRPGRGGSSARRAIISLDQIGSGRRPAPQGFATAYFRAKGLTQAAEFLAEARDAA
jgi:hypothetical protein